jgi:ArsR family transcriptional regulator, arsenate/arsenite/antimonite-responsive transcriptional repressor
MDTKAAVSALSALAQASRLSVFEKLVELGPDGAFPGELAQALDIPANTLSFHLKTLSHADLVTSEHNGRFIRYRANFGEVRELVDFLTRNCCGGDPSRCAPPASIATASAKPMKASRAR